MITNMNEEWNKVECEDYYEDLMHVCNNESLKREGREERKESQHIRILK